MVITTVGRNFGQWALFIHFDIRTSSGVYCGTASLADHGTPPGHCILVVLLTPRPPKTGSSQVGDLISRQLDLGRCLDHSSVGAASSSSLDDLYW